MRDVEDELGRKPPEHVPMLGVLADASSTRNSRHVGVLYQCEIDCKIYSERSDGFIADSPITGTYTLAELGRLTNLMEPRSTIATQSLMKIAKIYAESPERNPTVKRGEDRC